MEDDSMATKYGAAAKKKVSKVMKALKKGRLKSGTSANKVTSRKQAVAIGLSQARKSGAKVPRKKASTTARRRTGTLKRATPVKTAARGRKRS